VANDIKTNLIITREMARVLHQVGNFLPNVNTEYRSEFAKAGLKAGQSINMRLPSKFSVRKTKTYSGQDYVERSTPLAVLSQYGVDVSITTADRTCSLDDISKRILQPAAKQILATMEYDAMAQAYKYVNNYVNATTDTIITFKQFQRAGSRITDNKGPRGDRTALVNPVTMVEFNDATKGLYSAKLNLDKQFQEGMMLSTAGFDVGETTLLPSHTTGSLAGTPLTNGTTLGTSTTANVWVSQTTINVDGATSLTTVKAGDILTLSGVYMVDAETRQNIGRLQTFVVQADVTLTTAATGYDIVVKPGLMYGAGNAFQNCVLSGVANTDGLTVTRAGAASTAFGQDLFFHKDAFAFAFVDLEDVSDYGAKSTRATTENVSIRLVEQYNSTDDVVVQRFDVLWGFAPLYPELACRNLFTQSLAV